MSSSCVFDEAAARRGDAQKDQPETRLRNAGRLGNFADTNQQQFPSNHAKRAHLYRDFAIPKFEVMKKEKVQYVLFYLAQFVSMEYNASVCMCNVHGW